MFNLEQTIVEWRRQMIAAGIKSPVPMDELESHLRDDMERQMRSGVSAQKAFENAIQTMGEANALKHEFKKVVTNERKLMKKIMIIVAGVVGVLIGMGFVLPALAQYRDTSSMTGESVGLLLLGLSVTVGGLVAAFRAAKKRNA